MMFAVVWIQVVAWIAMAVVFILFGRVLAAAIHEPPRRCPFCGSKDTRVVVYKLSSDEWTCDKCGYLWIIR